MRIALPNGRRIIPQTPAHPQMFFFLCVKTYRDEYIAVAAEKNQKETDFDGAFLSCSVTETGQSAPSQPRQRAGGCQNVRY